MGSQIIRQCAVDEGLEDMFGGVKLVSTSVMKLEGLPGKEIY